MAQNNQLTIHLKLEGSNQVVTAVQQVQSQFNSFQQTLQAGFNLNLGAKLANTVLEAVGAFRQALSEGLQYAASLKDMSLQTGLTSEAVQVLGHAAAQSGAGIENVRSALMNLRQAATAAQTGNKDLAEAFARLGIDAKTITDLPLAAQLEEVAKAFASSGGDGKSFAALVQVLGERDVPRLQGLLQQLAQSGLGGMAQALQENGALLSSELIDKADEIDDRWGDLRVRMKSTFAELGILLKPFIDALQWVINVGLAGLQLIVRAFQNLANAVGAALAVLSGADWKTAWQTWLDMANRGAGDVKGQAQPGGGAPSLVDSPKTTGPTIAEMLAEQRKLATSMQPLWQQRETAVAAVTAAEKELQHVMDEGNRKGQIDTQALMTASLAVTKSKAERAKVEEQINAELDRQQQQNAQNAEIEASMLPLEAQQARARQMLAEAEQELARLLADEKSDVKSLLDAESARLRAKQALKSLDEQIARERAEKDNQAALDAADATARRLAAERAALEGDFSRTAADKWPERKRILAEEIANQQTLLALLIAKRDAARATGDTNGAAIYDQSARSVSTGVDALKNQQSGLGPDPRSMGQQLTAAITSAQSAVGTLAEQTARAFSSVGDSIRTSLGGAFADAVLKGGTFKERALGFADAVGTAFVNAGAQMVADWIYSHTIMSSVRSAFNALGITEKAATTSAEVGIHAAGEVAKTGATAAGATTRKGISLMETIFHGVQVGIRVAAHLAGELAQTAISLAQKAIRLPLILAESAAYLAKAAIGALSAMASIPYVGPILAVAAMGAIIAAGSSMLKGFSKGGLVEGAGTGTSDSVPARLSNGEFVATAAAVDRFGPKFFQQLNRGVIDYGALPSGAGTALPAVTASQSADFGPSTGDQGGSRVSVAYFNDEAAAMSWLNKQSGRKILYRRLNQERNEFGLES